jgi:anti-anti-sigma factor
MSAVDNANLSAMQSSNRLDRFTADGVTLTANQFAGAIVVAATGEFDAFNLHHLTDYAGSFITRGRRLVLDLSQLDFLAAQGIRILFELDGECVRTGAQWAVLTGRPVSRLLRICDQDARLPAVTSIDEALERFSRPTRARKLLQLVPKSG